MGAGFRYFLIDDDDNVIRISTARFNRIMDRHPKESILEYKNAMIRYAEVVVELENRKPAYIDFLSYGYVKFGSDGKIDQEFIKKKSLVHEQMMGMGVSKDSGAPQSEIEARIQEAGEKYKKEYTWIPSEKLEDKICKKALEK